MREDIEKKSKSESNRIFKVPGAQCLPSFKINTFPWGLLMYVNVDLERDKVTCFIFPS